MTLTLTLTPENETWLQEQARRTGLPPDEYALRVLDKAARAPEAITGSTPEQKAADFLTWAKSQNPGAPPLPLEAATREALYAEEEAPATETQQAA